MADEFASPVDTTVYGSYCARSRPEDDRPLYRFGGRVTADGSSDLLAEPGRYHLYAGWFCPWSHRATIVRALAGLEDVVSLSYVHGERDGRGWAFRAPTGRDPVNGFTLLRQAYERTEPGFDGHVSVPTLWDRAGARVVSNDPLTVDSDLAIAFRAWGDADVDLWPAARPAEFDDADTWIADSITSQVAAAGEDPAARARLLGAFAELDRRLASAAWVVGPTITLVDVRLWTTLVRYDALYNASLAINPGLREFPNLCAYARELLTHPAFRDTTDFTSFAEPDAPIEL